MNRRVVILMTALLACVLVSGALIAASPRTDAARTPPDLSGPWLGHMSGDAHGSAYATFAQDGASGTIECDGFGRDGTHGHGSGTYTQVGRKFSGTMTLSGDIEPETVDFEGKSNWKGSRVKFTFRTSSGDRVIFHLSRYH